MHFKLFCINGTKYHISFTLFTSSQIIVAMEKNNKFEKNLNATLISLKNTYGDDYLNAGKCVNKIYLAYS